MFGLSPAAWVIILTALATYIALLSSWMMALPAQRAALLQGNIVAVEAQLSDDRLVRDGQEVVIANMKQRSAQTASRDRQLIRRGRWLLLLSLLIFTAAVGLQAWTDAAFHQTPPAAPH